MTWRPTLWLVAILVVAVDQITKQWALDALHPGVKRPLVGDFLSLELVFNSGAAFSLGKGYTWILTVVALIVTVALVYFARRVQRTPMVILFGIGLGGAVGNLIDRLIRDPGVGQGHVIDMINYGDQFVGNVADIAIVGAASVAVLMGLLGKPILEPKPADATAPDATPSDTATGDATTSDSDSSAADATATTSPNDSEKPSRE